MNKARGGRSARSYTDEGLFQEIIDSVQSGDYVIIEFGHNVSICPSLHVSYPRPAAQLTTLFQDGGSLSTTDNGRTDCYGSGSETCTTPDGTIVQTFVTYVTNAGKAMTAKGAKVIVSSQTPNNLWETGTFSYTPGRFVEYAEISAKNIGSGATFVDHGAYVADIYKSLGSTMVNAFYPNDHTHTSPVGAATVSKAFVKGVLCDSNAFGTYVKNTTSSVPGNCL